ncbi:MAG: DUF2510 domain-containing protein [Ilumatobacteraceae bacterium]|nr:DUF2510 domain-containing protein [Ilumatobacteraceae bacterium]
MVVEAVAEGVAADAAAVEEPAGWAVAPEAEAEPDSEPSLGDLAAGATVAAAAAPAVAAPAEVTPAAPAEAAPAGGDPAAATDAAVPAGWYADPSGRFELRYWDGASWTEHVSRAGQQFTDPPVA